MRNTDEKIYNQIKKLTIENKRLSDALKAARKIADEKEAAMQNLLKQFKRLHDEHNTRLAEIKDLRQRYTDAITVANDTRKRYSKEVNRLLNSLREHR